ncbi:MAG: fumarylacetoacetate hydrolase family protein [Nocardioides sp.]|uniref:fumarylacetoacetate hydrolase family protein n=1 Tax=Nocardioides sp. TaxID=35761 RepID=UPI0039E64BDE
MRWCRFDDGGTPSFGIVEGTGEDAVVSVVDGSPFGEHRRTGRRLGVGTLRWLPPVIPSTFYAVGMNYTRHVEHARSLGNPIEVPTRPEPNYRAVNALTGHLQPIRKPPEVTGRFETEAEVVAVIGAPLYRCGRDEAAAAIFGWTIGNDVSARTWQHADRSFWRAKNADTFKPMGPWIDTAVDVMDATTTVLISGEKRASFATGDMLFDAVDFLVEIASYCTVSPGDVLWLGTDGAVGMDVSDTVEIQVTGLGSLINPVVADRPVPDRSRPAQPPLTAARPRMEK